MERETGIEPATNSLEGCDSTTELLPPKTTKYLLNQATLAKLLKIKERRMIALDFVVVKNSCSDGGERRIRTSVAPKDGRFTVCCH